MDEPGKKKVVAEKTSPVLHGASLLIGLQVGSRALTFLANQAILRFMTARSFGIATQLEVFYGTILFFSRESLRVAVQRQNTRIQGDHRPDSTEDKNDSRQAIDSQTVVNLGHLAYPIGSLVALPLGYLLLAWLQDQAIPYMAVCVLLYAVSALLELVAEPLFLLLQYHLMYKDRVTAESLAALTRCVVTLGVTSWMSSKGPIGVLPFAIGQVSSSICLYYVYLLKCRSMSLYQSKQVTYLPQKLPVSREESSLYYREYIYLPTLSIASSMFLQGIVKHFLTQGDSLLISALASPEAQGVYALANNYGSLIARLVLQPIEEMSRTYFSRLVSVQTKDSSEKKHTDEPTTKNPTTIDLSNSSDEIHTKTQEIHTASKHLGFVIRAYVLLSLMIVGVGPQASPLLLQIVAGRRWSLDGAGEVLSKYCYYLPLLALNGITEAFVASVASERQIQKQSLWMGMFSALFGMSGLIFLRFFHMGAVGLVYANCVNMFFRVVWSLAFIRAFFRQHDVSWNLTTVLPKPLTLLAGASLPFLFWGMRFQVNPWTHSESESIVDVIRRLVAIGIASLPNILLIYHPT